MVRRGASLLVGLLLVVAGIPLVALAGTPIGFDKSTIAGLNSGGATFIQPTTLQFGPDDRLYVGLLNGTIKIYDVDREGPNDYTASFDEQILAVKNIQNHDDNGSENDALGKRLMTGILVTGTASNPVIYATSSDPRIGGGAEGDDLNLDTNSGTLSRLTWNGSNWAHTILVRGLPRSEENHAPNGMALKNSTSTLYIAQGGNTNMGAKSHNFALLPEYALSAAILSVDLDAIGNTTYDLPTLNDEDRAGVDDANDPFGGNDGKNQAKLVAGGPVKVHAPGFRNAYDVLLTQSGRLYTIDNGPNGGWGDVPINEGPGGTCTNGVNEPGEGQKDTLHFVSGAGYYGGHPNPTRGNDANTFNASNPQSPVTSDNPIECDFQGIGSGTPAIDEMPRSTNGLDEYTTDNFAGAMDGDIIAVSYQANDLVRVKLNSAGDAVQLNDTLAADFGTHPLDVDVLGNGDPFPGTIWVADLADDAIYIFEPDDFGGGGGGGGCTGADNPSLDEDGDGYDNADEIDNGTDPCSAADVPPDADGDFRSDRNDPDDDNDGRPDTRDRFAVDAQNGTATTLPVELSWENDDPDPGGIANTGFTGLMTNLQDNYRTRFNPNRMVVGGAAGVLTVELVHSGDALGSRNSQKYGFQLGVDPPAGTFTVQTRIVAPFAGIDPENSQSMGLFVGPGTQKAYAKLVITANGGRGGIQFLKETRDRVRASNKDRVRMPGPDFVDLFLTVRPSRDKVKAAYQVTTGAGVTKDKVKLGTFNVPAGWTGGSKALAVGIISTSRGPGDPFPATWDFIRVYDGVPQ